MAKEPSDRFEDGAAMWEALLELPKRWTTSRATSEGDTQLALPTGRPISGSEPTRRADLPRSSSEPSGAPAAPPTPARSPPVEPAPSVVRPEPAPRQRGGLLPALLFIGALSAGAIWYFGLRPDEVAELGVASIQDAIAGNAPAGEAPQPAGEPAEPNEELANLLDEISGDWSVWEEDEDEAPVEDGEPVEDTETVEDVEPAEDGEPVENAEPAEDAEPVEDGDPVDTVSPSADPEVGEQVALRGASEGMPIEADPHPEVAADPDPAAPTDDAEEPADDADEEEEEPLGPNPWRTRTPTPLLVQARRMVLDERPLSRDEKQALRVLVRRDRNDVRPHLLMAQSFMADGNERLALDRYDLAYRVNEEARGDPRMLNDLVRLAIEGDVQPRAAEFLERVYGDAALPFVEDLLEDEELTEEQQTVLRAVHRRLVQAEPSLGAPSSPTPEGVRGGGSAQGRAGRPSRARGGHARRARRALVRRRHARRRHGRSRRRR